MARKIIIDTDPGQDDAVAILLALASPELDVAAVISVAGNVPLDLTTRNARVIVELSGRKDVPIHAGCDRPLKQSLVTAEHVHGETGLDGVVLPDPTVPVSKEHGVDAIIRILRDEPAGSVTLCPLGPLTNVATAFERAPDIVDRVAEIVLMGGAYFEVGNITPAAEFNIYVDPEAAKQVFASGAKLTVLPLDVTHKALITKPWLEQVLAVDTPVMQVMASWLDFYERFDVEKYGGAGGPLHDPCVIAWLLEPDMFSGRHINVEIETESTLTRGMTVADWWGVTDRAPNAYFVGDIQADRFFAMLKDRISTL